MERLKTSMGGLKGVVAGLIGAAGLGALVTELRETADQVGKVSARLGIGSSDLQKFQFAAMKSGMDVRQFNIALQRFTRRTSEAFIGTGEAKDAIAEFGIQLMNSEGKLRSNSDLLLEVSTILASNLIPQADKVRLAFKLFDSEGVKMLNMLQQGPEAIKGTGRELEALGGVINDETIVASEQLGDRWDAIMKKVVNHFGPAIQVANDMLGVFTIEAEMAGMTSEQLEKHITATRDALVEKKKALIDGKKGFNIFTMGARESAGAVDLEKKKIDDSIKSMNQQLDALKQAKKLRDIETRAILGKIEAQQKITAAIKEESKIIQNSHDMAAFLIEDESRLQIEAMEELKEKRTEETELKNAAREEEMQAARGLAASQEEQNKKMRASMFRDDETYYFSKNKLEEQAFRSTMSTMASMASAVKDEGIELFRFWQAAAIANTWMSTHEAAMKAWSQLGIFGAFAAGAIYVLGAAQIAKIAGEKPPGKQVGGDVMAGQPYLVGEQGPELFTPGQTGSIAPNRNSDQGVIINIYDGTGRKISQAMSDLRVEVVERANSFGQFAALESPLYTDAATT